MNMLMFKSQKRNNNKFKKYQSYYQNRFNKSKKNSRTIKNMSNEPIILDQRSTFCTKFLNTTILRVRSIVVPNSFDSAIIRRLTYHDINTSYTDLRIRRIHSIGEYNL